MVNRSGDQDERQKDRRRHHRQWQVYPDFHLKPIAKPSPGIFVKEEHLPAVQASSDLDLKAIYSRSLKSAKAVAATLSNIDLYSEDSDQSYQDLLSRDDVQAVIIALPIMNQPEFIRKALEKGKHVLAEKPLAKDVATGRELVEWYRGSVDTEKVTFGIAEQFRYLNVSAPNDECCLWRLLILRRPSYTAPSKPEPSARSSASGTDSPETYRLI